jgi:hypothetical protein
LYLDSGALANPATITPDTSPRGLKRSRSPDTYGDLPTGDNLGDDGTFTLTLHRYGIPIGYPA